MDFYSTETPPQELLHNIELIPTLDAKKVLISFPNEMIYQTFSSNPLLKEMSIVLQSWKEKPVCRDYVGPGVGLSTS